MWPMMRVGPDRFKLRWSTASVRGLAAGRFKLNRRVVDMKSVPQRALHALENAAACDHVAGVSDPSKRAGLHLDALCAMDR